MSARAPDQLIAQIVRSIDGLVVRRTADDGEHFLVVESNHVGEAEVVRDLVVALDEGAEIVHESHGFD